MPLDSGEVVGTVLIMGWTSVRSSRAERIRKQMSHEVYKGRALYAREPAWHRLGKVKEDGWYSADEALSEFGMDEEVFTVPVYVQVPDNHPASVGGFVKSEEFFATVQWDPADMTWRVHGAGMTSDYTVVQARTAFRFMDEVVGAVGGAHYEAVVPLRKGKQLVLLVNMEQVALDANGRNDVIKKYLLGVNSYDRSLAFRAKMTNVRVQCANMLAMALRGSGEKVVDGDWSTKHTSDVLNRVAAAQRTLGLYKDYNDVWFDQAELMIQTEMSNDTFTRLLSNLYEAVEEKVVGAKELSEKDRETMMDVRMRYELGPAQVNVAGTFWGGLQAVTENFDWAGKVHKAETRFTKQLDDRGPKGVNVKAMAWDAFYSTAKEYQRKVVAV